MLENFKNFNPDLERSLTKIVDITESFKEYQQNRDEILDNFYKKHHCDCEYWLLGEEENELIDKIKSNNYVFKIKKLKSSPAIYEKYLEKWLEEGWNVLAWNHSYNPSFTILNMKKIKHKIQNMENPRTDSLLDIGFLD